MAKLFNETAINIKGDGNADKLVAGKAVASKDKSGAMVNALLGDATKSFPIIGKDGTVTGEINPSQIFRDCIKKTVQSAGCPGKTELSVLDTCDVCTKGLEDVIPLVVREAWVGIGTKMKLPPTDNFTGELYLQNVPGATKVYDTKDMKTGAPTGTAEITYPDHIQLRAKSGPPEHQKTKVRKDPSGKVIPN